MGRISLRTATLKGILFHISFQTYIAEISTPRVRGAMGSIFQLAMTIGQLSVYVVVYAEATWRITALFACGLTALLVVLMVLMPETPPWFLANNMRHKALKELKWLRGSQYHIEEECFEIEADLGE